MWLGAWCATGSHMRNLGGSGWKPGPVQVQPLWQGASLLIAPSLAHCPWLLSPCCALHQLILVAWQKTIILFCQVSKLNQLMGHSNKLKH